MLSFDDGKGTCVAISSSYDLCTGIDLSTETVWHEENYGLLYFVPVVGAWVFQY